MKVSLLPPLVLLIASMALAAGAARVDPYHRAQGGYGYLIRADETCAVWWAEGAYKVLRDTPLPAQEKGRVEIWSAKNEYESFIVVLKPEKRMDHFRIELSELRDGRGSRIGPADIMIRKVEYVKVTKPTDSYGFTGDWPDPVPVYEKPETLYPGENQPFWVTVKVPRSAGAGDYTGELRLSSGLWRFSVPVTVHVWDFALPKTPSMRSGFGLNLSSVKAYENLTTRAQECAVFDHYMESFRAYKISPYNPFAYAPIKESVRGVA